MPHGRHALALLDQKINQRSHLGRHLRAGRRVDVEARKRFTPGLQHTHFAEYLPPYRKSADLIEASDADYTILRAAWLQDEDEVDYEITSRSEPFKGTEVSRKSVAALAVELIEHPDRLVRANVGVNKPNTDGDKPAFV